MEADLATGRAIQEGALPTQFPAFPGAGTVDQYASMDAAKEVGGDFYDFFEVDDHAVAFLIADVSGKGIPGALFMMSAKTEIQSRLSSGMEPAQAMAAANAYLCANNEADMFVTVWAATLDWRTEQSDDVTILVVEYDACHVRGLGRTQGGSVTMRPAHFRRRHILM